MNLFQNLLIRTYKTLLDQADVHLGLMHSFSQWPTGYLWDLLLWMETYSLSPVVLMLWILGNICPQSRANIRPVAHEGFQISLNAVIQVKT